ncbi:hypothetical protein RND81_08G065900 [Saponaria officinalis]|uniref:Uncharacterized protein n=1 Tax=Saponaria officinalis TaxID=3572 RepID=A0AAW1J455_SAPOF
MGRVGDNIRSPNRHSLSFLITPSQTALSLSCRFRPSVFYTLSPLLPVTSPFLSHADHITPPSPTTIISSLSFITIIIIITTTTHLSLRFSLVRIAITIVGAGLDAATTAAPRLILPFFSSDLDSKLPCHPCVLLYAPLTGAIYHRCSDLIF